MPIIGADENGYHFVDESGQPQFIARAGLEPNLQASLDSQVPPPAAQPTPAPNASPVGEPSTSPFGVQLASLAPDAASRMSGQPDGSQIPNYGPTADPHGLASPSGAPAAQPPAPGAAPMISAEAEKAAGAAPAPGQKVDVSQLATTKPAQSSQVQSGLARANAIEGDYNKQESAIRQGADAGAKAAAEKASYLDTMGKELQRQQLENQKHEQERQSYVQQQMQKYNQMSEEVRTAKIDPNHYWADKSTGDRIMAGIGIMLGALSQGMTGAKENPGLVVIQNAINRDIDAQKANLSQKNTTLNQQGSLLSMARERFHDERTAEAAARAMALDNAKMKLDQIAARYDSPILQANAKKMSAELDAQKQQLMMSIQTQLTQQAALHQLSSGGGGQVNPEMLPKEAKERVVTLPGGKQALAADPETARKVRDFTSKDEAFQKDLDDLIGFAKKHQGTTLDRAIVNKGKSMAANLQNKYRNLEDMGVFKESEAEFMKNLIGDDPTTYFNYIPQLETLKQSTASGRDSFYQTHVQGYRPVNFTKR
jgi:hypothetical protein